MLTDKNVLEYIDRMTEALWDITIKSETDYTENADGTITLPGTSRRSVHFRDRVTGYQQGVHGDTIADACNSFHRLYLHYQKAVQRDVGIYDLVVALPEK